MIFHLLKVKLALLVLVFMLCIITSFACADEEKGPENKVKGAEYYNHLGVSHSKSGKYHEAIEMYKQAIRLNPAYARAYINLGVAYRKSGRNRDAIETYKQAIRLNPTSPTAYYNFGISYSKSGKYQEAIEMYKQAIKIDPDYTKAHYNLGLIYLIEQDKRSARDECEILKELDKDKANKLFILINR